MSDDAEGLCELCKNSCKTKCSKCKLVYYCSVEHQKEHWIEHKEHCKSYEIRENQTLGKFLVAKRDLERDEIIFVDSPLFFGPGPYKIEEESPFSCVGCSKILLDEIRSCPECGWPACNFDCEGLKSPQMHGLECQILKLKPRKPNESDYDHFRFDTLIILRALFLQKTNKKKWDALMNLEDHLNDRGPNNQIFKIVQEKVSFIQENFIKPLQLFEKENGQVILPIVSADIMHKIYATLDVNATEISDPVDLFILYPTASLIEHNCVPNTCQIIDENNNGYKVTFRAAMPIKKGEHITSTYTNILWGTQERRRHLKESKYFSCICKRCSDPTELGTYFSALLCLGSDEKPCKGIQLPTHPTEDNCLWMCNQCHIKLPNKEIIDFVSHLNNEVNKELEKKPQMEALEEFMNKLQIFLHPNHFLMYSVKHSLVQLYDVNGDIEISNAFLEDKMKICNEMIQLTKKLDPGNARLALYLAVLLNEQSMAKFKVLTRCLGSTSEELESNKELIQEVFSLFEENRRVLKYEREFEAGSKLLQVVESNEIKFKNWLSEHNVII
ncbi:hypothetical protein ABEB36_008569 [Hypothenemus hampei]|uniref:Protein msta n=1 Tax=Hypothenemus hampei TaxID=57062 RepID=A0ABD1EMS2_HYPHA